MSELSAIVASASDEEVEAAFDALMARVGDDPPKAGLARLQRWRDRIVVCRSKILADQRAAGLNDRQLDRMLGLQNTSRAERRRDRQRAETLGRNEELAGKVDRGELTVTQLDAICEADAKTGGKAATDVGLLDDIAAGDTDGARRTADRWVAARASNEELEEKRRLQRERRDVRKGQTFDGLASLTISGDDESVHHMWRAISRAADKLYKADGGRDIPAGKHPRTGGQRLFDAAYVHLVDTPPGAKDGDASRSKPQGASNSGAARSAGGGAHLSPVIVVTAQKLAGTDNTPAEMIGVGPIADSRFDELACNATFVGMLFDGAGEVLWLGRGRRRPSREQTLALIVRDKGCVLCGADAYLCHAHHLMPWNAPGKGTTDIDNLALLCPADHHELHDQKLTLYRDPVDGRWKRRRATPDEIPPPRPAESAKPTPNGADAGAAARPRTAGT